MISMRDSIELVEAFLSELTEAWGKPLDTTFWYDAKNDKLIDCRSFHHTEFVLMKPDAFRITPEELMALKQWKGSYDDFLTMMDEHARAVADQDIIDAVIARGFIRVTKETQKWAGRTKRALGLQGTARDCRKAIAHFESDGYFPDRVITQGYVIYGDDIETFVKSGKIVSDERGDYFRA
jgi:hypothetical protein